MAGACEDFRSWHLANLKDPVKAAYFLLAALEDSLELNMPKHFMKAAREVFKFHGASSTGMLTFVFTHLKVEDQRLFLELALRVGDKLMVEKLTSMELEYT